MKFTQKDIDRFWSHVDKSGKCWVWTGSRNHDGYGRFNTSPKIANASRVSWIIAFGNIPSKMCVCHHCDNPACVKPSHLFLGTRSDNARDMVSKGRWGGPKGDTHPFRINPELASHGEKHWSAKLTEKDVRSARKLRTNGMTFASIASKFGVDLSCIALIIYRKTWKHVK